MHHRAQLRSAADRELAVTRGSWIHDDLGDHLKGCAQCRAVNAETVRAARRSVDDATLAALCPSGRSIYQAYLSWLAEPDE